MLSQRVLVARLAILKGLCYGYSFDIRSEYLWFGLQLMHKLATWESTRYRITLVGPMLLALPLHSVSG